MESVALDARPGERLKAAAVGDIDADREQIGGVLRDPDVFENADGRLGVSSIRITMSLVRLLSPRASEPNNAA
jgi:hypothetical protein